MFAALVGVASTAGCRSQRQAYAAESAPAPGAGVRTPQASAEFNPRLLRRFQPARAVMAADPASVTDARVALGRMLFYDQRLSRNQGLSCNSCHRLNDYGVDRLKTSPGHKGRLGRRNAPTVYHAAAYTVQFWDGRAPDVEAQAQGPILNPIEMAMRNAAAVETVLKSIPGYREPFQGAFPGEANPITLANVGRAIGAFERRLATTSRWDRYLTGDRQALTPLEKEGLKAFTNLGCMVCHTGEVLGGTSYQKVGAVEPWPNQADLGRYEITKAAGDQMMFKVPTLRNIEKTAPYFHDGSAGTLDAAIKMMGKHQLGLELTDAEVRPIAAWLKALTGELPTAYIAPPALPSSSASTPRPDPA